MPNYINSKKTKQKNFQNGPKMFLSRTKSRESVGNAKQTNFYFKPEGAQIQDFGCTDLFVSFMVKTVNNTKGSLATELISFELRHEKTCILHMQKQRRRSAVQ